MRIAIVLVVLCAFACLGSATAIKKSQLRSNSTLNAQVLTRDNYAASCGSVSLSGSTLSAQCRNKAGNFRSTSLNLDNCLSNYNGVFMCGGAYSRSAKNQRFSGSIIVADLQTQNGAWVSSGLDLNRVISNIDGQLVCDCYRTF